jgi:hypothetical protein
LEWMDKKVDEDLVDLLESVLGGNFIQDWLQIAGLWWLERLFGTSQPIRQLLYLVDFTQAYFFHRHHWASIVLVRVWIELRIGKTRHHSLLLAHSVRRGGLSKLIDLRRRIKLRFGKFSSVRRRLLMGPSFVRRSSLIIAHFVLVIKLATTFMRLFSVWI